jgi:hypothetical protein
MAKFPAPPKVGVGVPRIITGLPAKVKERPRADFRPGEFDRLITTKGYKMWWSRRGICPCLNNDQTEQPDPVCRLCRGDGYYSFMPDAAVKGGATQDGFDNPVIAHPDGNAVQIYVLMTSMTQDVEVFEKFGEWVFGTARATTQYQNKLGYRDRLVPVDSAMTWMQVVEYDGATTIPVVGKRNKKGVRYPLIAVDELRSVDKVFKLRDDFEVVDGEIQWQPNRNPVTGTRLSLHATIHPPWVVLDHVNAYRDTLLTGGGAKLEGQKFQNLPVQATVKLEFLVEPSEG